MDTFFLSAKRYIHFEDFFLVVYPTVLTESKLTLREMQISIFFPTNVYLHSDEYFLKHTGANLVNELFFLLPSD